MRGFIQAIFGGVILFLALPSAAQCTSPVRSYSDIGDGDEGGEGGLTLEVYADGSAAMVGDGYREAFVSCTGECAKQWAEVTGAETTHGFVPLCTEYTANMACWDGEFGTGVQHADR